VFVNAIRVAKMFSLAPVPDMFAQIPSPIVRGRGGGKSEWRIMKGGIKET